MSDDPDPLAAAVKLAPETRGELDSAPLFRSRPGPLPKPAPDLEPASDSAPRPDFERDPLSELPKVCVRRAAAEAALRRIGQDSPLTEALAWIAPALRKSVKVSFPEILWRPSGTLRPGVIAHLSWPRLAARIGFAVETPIAHKVVDDLLGYQRLPGEDRLQISPVEYGVWTYILTQSLARLQDSAGPFGEWDLTMERVGPQAFEPNSTAPTMTICWPVRVGSTQGAVRLWLPESLAMQWALEAQGQSFVPEPRRADDLGPLMAKYGQCSSIWRAEVGTVALPPEGIAALRRGVEMPIIDHPIQGTKANPQALLVLRAETVNSACEIPAKLADQGRGAAIVAGPLRILRRPSSDPSLGQTKELSAMSASAPQPSPAVNFGVDLPVTLIVELGRVGLPLAKLADLKPGDILDLKRNSREPVELTSNGRLIARGELVRVEENIGVRITYVLT